MTRNFKILGIALLATVVMGATGASAASAHVFHSESVKTKLTGAQATKNKLTVAGLGVECTTATFIGSMSEKTQSEVQNIAPTYAGCVYGSNAATVSVNNCSFTLTSSTDATGDATTRVLCPTEKHIEIEVPAISCIITLKDTSDSMNGGSQTATGGVHYTNEGAGTTRDTLIDLTATVKIDHDFIKGVETIACKNVVGTAKLTGTVTVKGDEEGTPTQVGIWVE